MTTFLAQIIGPTLLAAAIGFLLNPKFHKKIIKDFEAHEGLTYFTGIFTMLVGLLIVTNHNIWECPTSIIITIFGWGGVLKGATFLIFPNLLFAISRSAIKNQNLVKSAMFGVLILGVYLSYFGYFA